MLISNEYVVGAFYKYQFIYHLEFKLLNLYPFLLNYFPPILPMNSLVFPHLFALFCFLFDLFNPHFFGLLFIRSFSLEMPCYLSLYFWIFPRFQYRTLPLMVSPYTTLRIYLVLLIGLAFFTWIHLMGDMGHLHSFHYSNEVPITILRPISSSFLLSILFYCFLLATL